MDQFSLFMFDLSEMIDRSYTECDQERHGQHRQDEHQIIEDEIDISPFREDFALRTHISQYSEIRT